MAVDLTKVNYILLRADGSILAQSMDYYVQQGSTGVDKIYFGSVAAQNTDIGEAICTLPNGEQNTIMGVWDTCTYQGYSIGGFVFTLTTAQTNYQGGLMMALSIFRSGQRLVNYPLYVVINETGLMSDTNTGVTVEEINTYLLYAQTMLRINDGILVIDSLAAVTDWSQYQTGQLFYSKADGYYYEKIAASPYYKKADSLNGILGGNHVIIRYDYDPVNSPKTVAEMYALFGTRTFILNIQGQEYFFKISSSGNYDVSAFNLVSRTFWRNNSIAGTNNIHSILISTYQTTFVEHRSQSGNNAYVNVGGTDTLMKVSSNAEGGIMSRNSSGQTKVGDPTEDAHAATKKYVDDSDDAIEADVFTNYLKVTYEFSKDTTLGDIITAVGGVKKPFVFYYTALLNGGVPGTGHDNCFLGYIESASVGQCSFIPLKGNIKYGTWKSNLSSCTLGEIISTTYETRLAAESWVDSYYVKLRTDTGLYVYGHNGSTQSHYTLSSDVVSGAVVKRKIGSGDGTLGAILVPAPQTDTEAANKKYVDDSIDAAVSTLYEYKGSKTVAELNALTGQEIGDVYNVSDEGTLTDGNIHVLAGDNVVWDGEEWDKLAGTVDLTGYYTKVEVDALLLQKATISVTVMDDDIVVNGGVITQIRKANDYYDVAQSVDITTIPKVVQSTTDLPATNDGYLYLVLDNGYLYSWQSGAWAQAYQYTSDLLTITTVVVDED